MFRGTFFHTLDEKGRVAIPRKFREALAGASGDPRIVITKTAARGLRYLDIHPMSGWELLEQRIGERPQFTPATQRFKRRYVHPAQDLSLDAQGRIVIPGDLRTWAELEKDLVFTGDLEKFLLWPLKEWQRVQSADNEADEQVEELGAQGEPEELGL